MFMKNKFSGLQQMKLSHRFAAIAGVFAVGFVIVGLSGYRTLSSVQVNGPIYLDIVRGKDLVADILPPPNYIIESYLNVVEAQTKTGKADLEKLQASVSRLQKDYDQRLEFWKKESLEPELQKALLEGANAPVSRFYELAQKEYFPALLAGDREAARKVLSELQGLYEQHRAGVENVAKLAAAYNTKTETYASETIQLDLLLMAGLLAASLTAGLFFATISARRIIREVGGEPSFAAEVASRVARGDLTSDIQVKAGDESSIVAAMARMQESIKSFVAAQNRMKQEHDAGTISYRIDTQPFSGSYREMAEGVNELVAAHISLKMKVVEIVGEYAKGNLTLDMDRLPGEKAKITEAIDAVKHSLQSVNGEIGKLVAAASMGDFSQRGDAARYEYDFREMVEGLNRLMEAADSGLTVVVGVLNKVAEGDLTQRVDGDLRGQFAQLQSDTNKTVEQLARVIGQIREGADTINLASKEIAQGNNDLSQRTEEQASSLEETASSMEELTATVRQNAENSRQANQLAAGASEVAVKGGDMVRQVVETMGGITESSKKIADIISVIDGIAFQTNILALNAAVEAARAGEQGRGFAVVATEVRNLAQRSANAAKEIKQLISDSVNTVEAGSKLVNEAGSTMDEIVSSVKRVTDIMAEITAASQEQSGGIEQVNQAVTQMDEVTQQNAALVEQAAAAAESMQEQAGALVEAVSVFKVVANDAGAKAWSGSTERRGPDRAKNVARIPHAKPVAKSAMQSKPVPEPKKVVNSDDWHEF